jgi:hypothetical protein
MLDGDTGGELARGDPGAIRDDGSVSGRRAGVDVVPCPA